MEKIKLSNGFIKLTNPNGVVDTRDNTKTVHSEAIVKESDAKYFVENKI